MHAVRRDGSVSGASVLVSGAGPIGNFVAQVAQWHSAADVVLTDVSDGDQANGLMKGHFMFVIYSPIAPVSDSAILFPGVFYAAQRIFAWRGASRIGGCGQPAPEGGGAVPSSGRHGIAQAADAGGTTPDGRVERPENQPEHQRGETLLTDAFEPAVGGLGSQPARKPRPDSSFRHEHPGDRSICIPYGRRLLV